MLRLVIKTGESVIVTDADGKPIGSIQLKKSGGTRSTLLIQMPQEFGLWREEVYQRIIHGKAHTCVMTTQVRGSSQGS